MILHNLEQFEIPEFIIIGSGPAGITLALELEKQNKRVLIIEGGSEEETDSDRNRNLGEVIGDKYFDLRDSRARMFGGTSNKWGGACAPLDNPDFKEWPIEKKDLDIYENQTKKILNINNDFIKYKNSDFNSFQISSILYSDVNFSFNYLDHVKKSNKIFLLLNNSLLFFGTNQSGKQIKKLFLKNKSKEEMIDLKIDTKIILACGGIENSRILLWAREKSNNNFLQELPIGRYWMEHPSGEIGQFISKVDDIKKIFEPLSLLSNTDPLDLFLVPKKKFLEENQINNLRLSLVYPATNDELNYKDYLKDLICLAPNFTRKFIDRFSDDNFFCSSQVKFSAEQKPDYNNFVSLSDNSVDDLGIPRVKLKWEIKDDVFIALKKCLEQLGKEAIDLNIGRVGIDQSVYDQSFKKSKEIYANHHHMGGTIITSQERKGVVDANLKVLNTENLYVLGSSVFPSGGHFNPTFTIVQLSLRLANHFKNI